MNLEQKVAKLLTQRNQTLSVAESCTGGLLSNRITNIPGSSLIFKGAIIAYFNDVKTNILSISSQTLKKHGAVSDNVACAMAEKVREKINTNFGIGISGIAGPAGGSKLKPVGLVYIAVSTQIETLCLKCQFKGSRSQIKTQAVNQALNLLLEFLI